MSKFIFRFKIPHVIKYSKNIWSLRRHFNDSKSIILGIETSCDETGCGIVTDNGILLGEALNSQQHIHLNNGGIIPPIAQSLHREHIEDIVARAVRNANISINDVDAIATTVKPGLPLSLSIGMKYGKYLCETYTKPFIPIHHMEAHALTVRMIDQSIQFPYLCLLISGGHCLLTIVKSVVDFLLLGQSLDDAPGEAFDKMARRLKLRNLPKFKNLSGGQAIELAASYADNPLEFDFPAPLSKYKDCNFSMAGIKNTVLRHIMKQEEKYNIRADGIIPGLYNLCAGLQLVVTRHLCHRTQRAIEFIDMKDLLPKDKRVLVVSGGVASNNFIMRGLKLVCDSFGYKLIFPPPELCTDNGIMIAWNGAERYQINESLIWNYNSIDIEPKAKLGRDISEQVVEANLKCNWVKLKTLVDQKQEKLQIS